MALPVKACTLEELEDYAPIHPEAAQELAERLAAGKDLRLTREHELEEEVREAERAQESAEEASDQLRETIAECCNQLEQALAEKATQDIEAQVRNVIRRLEKA
ncbi:hypothetical protein SAMN05878276_0381 [Aquipseudomonas alcaligenes]|uniref:hypothetical protein n=1 Tax=Aquipseudomonas alcaligenes TaxID=43263 RepID=UPI0009568A11|nr:hypothetical protein [Pseudomonas alcaligenes]SIR82110.1 hypothetical protein SAMN05878276_0381 [Pseudomonas alcaligenes]